MNSKIIIDCRYCSQKLRIPNTLSNTATIKCPKCQNSWINNNQTTPSYGANYAYQQPVTQNNNYKEDSEDNWEDDYYDETYNEPDDDYYDDEGILDEDSYENFY
ncbi:hypothetical protein GM3708_3591 (plasmid) [Geminocystis sp. NIES-3708]|uniref:hypothetical protein n=1 Tax=Geminocystis sp. NIES-3708 TaxID=1615909 RepID=UPI0005FCDBF8|nr:hypothetical protein [Geminocystis sp. NIES-3708]BAQ63185.1 hypothetical protein GM3708_3591 [Geminocystis sp. NIES-3708]